MKYLCTYKSLYCKGLTPSGRLHSDSKSSPLQITYMRRYSHTNLLEEALLVGPVHELLLLVAMYAVDDVLTEDKVGGIC